MLMKCKLNLLEDEPLSDRTRLVPCVFLGNDAFPLFPNLLKDITEECITTGGFPEPAEFPKMFMEFCQRD